MNLPMKRLTLAAAGLALTALLAGCAQPNPQTGGVAAAPKTPAQKVLTSFTPALRCMDDLFLAYGKRDIVMTTAGIPDSTGKVMAGTKEMLISAISKTSIKSRAISFVDYDTERNDLLMLFQDIQQAGASNRRIPNYYIRGAITQLDDNALDSQQSAGLALPFLDLGISRDQVVSMLSVDMNIGESTSRTILPGVNASNSMAIVRSGKAGEAGGKIGKAGLNISMSLNQSEGAAAGARALIELGVIELLGKLTNVPYWKCLEIDKTNPQMMQQAMDWYDGMAESDRVKFVQRKLSGAGIYSGPISGQMDRNTIDAVSRFKAEHGLIANGRIDFDTYYALLDSDGAAAGSDSQATPISAPARQQSSTGGPLKVTLTSDRGNRPVYRPGEALRGVVEMNNDGFLYCYYKDAGGAIARIFPNRFQPDPFVKGAKQMSLPGDNVPFKIKFDTTGREQVFCIGSDRDVALPPALKASDLAPLKVKTVEEVISAFKQSNPTASDAKMDISIQ